MTLRLMKHFTQTCGLRSWEHNIGRVLVLNTPPAMLSDECSTAGLGLADIARHVSICL
jgi:hypothetical protein